MNLFFKRCVLLLTVFFFASTKMAEGSSPGLSSFEKLMEPFFKYSGENVTDVEGSTCSNPGHCGRAYQACCFGFAAKGYPCDCHLEPGSGTAGQNCGDCGTAYAACCIAYKADGYPCECDVA